MDKKRKLTSQKIARSLAQEDPVEQISDSKSAFRSENNVDSVRDPDFKYFFGFCEVLHALIVWKELTGSTMSIRSF